MSKPESVSILGAGQWGTTLAILAAKNGHTVYLYERDPETAAHLQKTRENPHYLKGIRFPDNIQVTSDLDLIFKECTLVLPVIPSKAIRAFAKKLSEYVKPHHILIHGTKGLEIGTHKRMSEILLEETKTKKIGALSGPNLAVELARGEPAATVVASADKDVISHAQKIFGSSQFRIYGNTDLVGVEWAGSLKNILAVASGICHGIGYGQNVTSMLITRGFAEMSRLTTSMGADSSTLVGLAGIGDIITTCTSPLSRNFRAGELLAKGKTLGEVENELAMTVEGINTVRTVAEIAREKKISMPITEALEQIIFNGQPIKKVLSELMLRPAQFEFEFSENHQKIKEAKP